MNASRGPSERRRAFIRLDARLPVTYRVVGREAPAAAWTRDIAGGGVGLTVTEPLGPGTLLAVELGLPGREPPVGFTGAVVWSREAEPDAGQESREHMVGLRFVHIGQEERDAIMRHVVLTFGPQEVP